MLRFLRSATCLEGSVMQQENKEERLSGALSGGVAAGSVALPHT